MGATYYEVLGVDPDATPDEIESAYRDRVLETHPDHSDAPDAAERFQRVQTARSVLTDGDERARYDRLGHEAYVGLADGTANDGSADKATDADRNTGRRRSHATGGHTSTTGSTDGGGGTTAGTEAGGATSGRRTGRRSDRARGSGRRTTDRTASHHARQRSRRRQQRATRQATGDWPFGEDDDEGATESTGSNEGDGDATAADDFSYSVHGWDDEIDLEWEGRRIDGSAATSVGAVAVLYPLLVWATLTPFFSLPVNAVLAACTLALVGYLLTMPRLAIGVFGGWSVLFPLGIAVLSPIEIGSLLGLFALGFVWIPLGYAVVLWWVLRP
ncbi:molecular chaperone DnaJ [Natrinema mahii]|nr:molecular chaperone DnaJ [Natrinema mahii]